MPYFFVCPKCQQNNYGYKNHPQGNSYYDELQCKRCGEKDLYWVESKELAQRLKVALSKVAVGFGESPIQYFDPSVPTGDLEKQIMPRMSSHATLVAPYSQGTRSKAFTPNVVAIQEGQCEGQCLHWIRRVLQGGREVYLVPVKKGDVVRTDDQLLRKQKKQHLIGAKAQTLKVSHGDSQKVLKDKIAEVKQKVEDALRKHGITCDGVHWTIPHGKRQLYDAAMKKQQEIIDNLVAQGFYAHGWEELARELDQVVDKVGGSKRPFSNILTVKCVNRTKSRFGSGNSASFAAAVANHPDFQPGRGVLMSVGLLVGIGESGGKISGHAIAAHCKSTSEFYLFDPNLGIFRAGSRDSFRRALDTLMGQVWQFDLNWQLDGTFGYAIFRAAAKEQDQKQNEKPVSFSAPSPKFVAIENKSLGTIPNTPKVPVSPPKGKTTGVGQKFAPQSPPKSVGTTTKPRGNVGNLIDKFNKGH